MTGWTIPCFLIGNTTSNGQFSIVMLVFFFGGVGGGFKFPAFFFGIFFLPHAWGGKFNHPIFCDEPRASDFFQLLGVESNNPNYPDPLKLAIQVQTQFHWKVQSLVLKA